MILSRLSWITLSVTAALIPAGNISSAGSLNPVRRILGNLSRTSTILVAFTITGLPGPLLFWEGVMSCPHLSLVTLGPYRHPVTLYLTGPLSRQRHILQSAQPHRRTVSRPLPCQLHFPAPRTPIRHSVPDLQVRSRTPLLLFLALLPTLSRPHQIVSLRSCFPDPTPLLLFLQSLVAQQGLQPIANDGSFLSLLFQAYQVLHLVTSFLCPHTRIKTFIHSVYFLSVSSCVRVLPLAPHFFKRV